MKKSEKINTKLVKKILNDKEFKKIKNIKNKEEKTEALKYLITSKLYLKYHDLEDKIEQLKKRKINDCFFAELELMKTPYKIKLFKSGFEEELENILNKLEEIEKTLKNV